VPAPELDSIGVERGKTSGPLTPPFAQPRRTGAAKPDWSLERPLLRSASMDAAGFWPVALRSATLLAIIASASGWAGGRAQVDASSAKPLSAAELQVLALQVALDRAGFSPGEIDAQLGENTDKALAAFQAARGLGTTIHVDDATAAALGDPFRNPLTSYIISTHDVSGTFTGHIPEDMMAMADLGELGYQSITELLAERFHMSPVLLERLNPGVRYESGAELRVPNVDPLVVPLQKGPRPGKQPSRPEDALTVVISGTSRTLTVQDDFGAVRLHLPVSVGSERDPLPSGELTVVGVYLNPVFYYNPALFWDADPSHAKAKIQPGPNNPVGFVWIDLSREHLGIHGTPHPSTVGRTQSHGCIRLTNWDALRLADLVSEGTRVVLQ
jgi:lipoprotein-anchoring transpeptidase ErfK/SrfK